ncbi:MAG: hypothetical protein DMF73_04910 [Acidobacteria bacterium]|nr:MAG: hypothetical protein DMF73_04910 [Acidobacteriota bacterium]
MQQPVVIQFQNQEASFCWERGRLVRTEREARNDPNLPTNTSHLPARCGRGVRAPSIKFTALVKVRHHPATHTLA